MSQSIFAVITGMHRSGTSMLAQMLAHCGLWLGEKEDLISANDDNPDGYWENRHFVGINDHVLSAFGGSWSEPPPLSPDWVNDPQLDALAVEASKLIATWSGMPLCGWKDPRTSLTLEFWRRVVPDLRVIICVRNPVEVALSLSTRENRIAYEQAINLCSYYYQSLKSELHQDSTLVSHYDAYFRDPHAELTRIVRWLDLPADDNVIREAAQTFKSEHRRFKIADALMMPLNVPPALIDLYHEFRKCAGYENTASESDNIFEGLIERIDKLHTHNDQLSTALKESELELKKTQGYVAWMHNMPGWSLVLLWERLSKWGLPSGTLRRRWFDSASSALLRLADHFSGKANA